MAGKGTKTNNKRKDSPAKEDFEDVKRAKTADEQTEGKNPGNVIGGLKSTLKNPNVSDAAKEHAEEMLGQMDVDTTSTSSSSSSSSRDDGDFKKKHRRYNDQFNKEGKDLTHVLAGYKGTLNNASTSEEAKEHARQMIEELEGHQSAGGHLGHVAGGHKSTLKNDNSSEKDKERARKILKELGADDDYEYSSQPGDEKLNTEGKDITHVIAGYKGTLNNASVSDEAKEHAKKMLEELEGHQSEGRHLGHAMHSHRSKLADKDASRETKDHSRRALKEFGDDEHNYSYTRDERYNKEGRDVNHIIGGYKATLSNEKTSEEAKEHARKMLEELGPEEHHEKYRAHGGNLGNVIGGYKATLNNDKVSDEAKEHARKMLEELGAEEYEYSNKYSRGNYSGDKGDKNFNQVMGGFKATIHNPNSSEEAKEHARQMLSDNGIDEDSKLQSGKDESEKNPGNVVGGLKAALANPKVSDAAKDDVRNKLDAQLEKTAH